MRVHIPADTRRVRSVHLKPVFNSKLFRCAKGHFEGTGIFVLQPEKKSIERFCPTCFHDEIQTENFVFPSSLRELFVTVDEPGRICTTCRRVCYSEKERDNWPEDNMSMCCSSQLMFFDHVLGLWCAKCAEVKFYGEDELAEAPYCDLCGDLLEDMSDMKVN